MANEKRKIFAPLGSSNHVKEDRAENDLYCTPSIATECLLKVEEFVGTIWEPTNGLGNISDVLEENGHEVIRTDLIDYGNNNCISGVDFLKCDKPLATNFVFNPPYNMSTEFVEKAIELLPEDGTCAVLLKTLFLEGQKRYYMFKKTPPSRVWVFSKRIDCAKNGDFDFKSGAVSFSWFVWEQGYTGKTTIDWIMY